MTSEEKAVESADAVRFEMKIWADGQALDADGNSLDHEGNPITESDIKPPVGEESGSK